MRWDGLFADLEAQLAHGQWQDTEAEAAELTRGERASITLAERLRGVLGGELQLQLVGGDRVQLTVSAVGESWVGGHDHAGGLLVPLAAVQAVDASLVVAAPDSSPGRRRLGIGSAYRVLSRVRAGVEVRGRDGQSLGDGTIDRVGHAHVDLAVHPRADSRRPRRVRSRRALPFAAVGPVRSTGASLC